MNKMLTMVKAWFVSLKSTPETSTSMVPATPATATAQETEVKEGEPVAGTFVPDALAVDASSYSAVRTEHFRRIVDTFDEDKQHWLGWLVMQYFTVFAYVMPPITAFIVGNAIGDAFSGPFSLWNAYSVYAHFISIALEMAIPLLALVIVTLCKRAVKEKGQLTWCIVVSILFLATSVGNSYAQMYLMDQHVNAASFGSVFGLYYRAYGPLLIDSFSAIFLSVVGVRNRQKFIANEREKNEAIIDVSRVFIEQEKVLTDADIAQKTARMEAASKLRRAEHYNHVEEDAMRKILEAGRRSMDTDDNSSNGYRRGRY